MKNKKIN
jgi:ABC-type Zn2+ transport system substrate-binding protein/surface adhesin